MASIATRYDGRRVSKREKRLDEGNVMSTFRGTKGFPFFATCAPGDEKALLEEILGPRVRARHAKPTRGGVRFAPSDADGTLSCAYRACLWSRSSLRVMHLLREGNLMDTKKRKKSRMESLHEFVGHAVEWNAYMPRTEPTVGVRVASKKDARNTCSTVSHAICERTGASSVKTKHASLPIWYAESDDGTVSIHRDLCGTSLHQRGYREDIGSHRAALRSTCAYRCLFISGWSERWMDHVLIDPMCGAGTMLLEAAQTRMDMAPGLLRKEWPFQRWPDYDARVWEECVSEAEEAKRTGQERWHRDGTPPILGADVHPGAVALARDAIRQAGLEDWISVQQSDCKDWDLNERIEASTKRLVMTNPPWGMRLGTEEVNRAGGRSHRGQGMEQAMAEESWMSLRLFLKSNCSKSDAYVLCGNPDMSKHLRMRAEKKYPIWAGGVDSRLLHYCVY